MGNKQTTFSEEQLENYVDTTFLTKTEILRVFKRFCEIQDPPCNFRDVTYEALTATLVNYPELAKCPELKENPFRKRICRVFSSQAAAAAANGGGGGSAAAAGGGGQVALYFDEFLQLYSTFSEKAPREMKVHYAFKIYDFDGDNFIGAGDIEHAVKLLTQNELAADEIESIWEKVLFEADIDDDRKLSPSEFEHVITKSPDFLSTFHFRI